MHDVHYYMLYINIINIAIYIIFIIHITIEIYKNILYDNMSHLKNKFIARNLRSDTKTTPIYTPTPIKNTVGKILPLFLILSRIRTQI